MKICSPLTTLVISQAGMAGYCQNSVEKLFLPSSALLTSHEKEELSEIEVCLADFRHTSALLLAGMPQKMRRSAKRKKFTGGISDLG